MMSRWTWRGGIAGTTVVLLAYLLGLLAFAPAALLDAGLQRATGGKLRLAQAQGTLWSGSGQIEIRDASGRQGIGRNVAWSLARPALWGGRLEFDVTTNAATRPFSLRISPSGIEASDVDLSLPARALGLAVPQMAAFGPQGDLDLHLDTLTVARGDISMDAVVTWRNARSTLASVAPLGSYQLRVAARDGAFNADLRTLDGPLQLQGSGSWGGSRTLPFSATARIDAAHYTQLAPLLRLVAVERGEGAFVLQFSSPLGMGRR